MFVDAIQGDTVTMPLANSKHNGFSFFQYLPVEKISNQWTLILPMIRDAEYLNFLRNNLPELL